MLISSLIFKSRKIFLSILLLVFCFSLSAYASGDVQHPTMHLIDVGYGDSFFLELPSGKNLMIDAGGKSAGQKLINYLKSLGVKEIDSFILTHPHKNHFGGLFSVIENFKLNKIYTNGDRRGEEGYEALMEIVTQQQISVKTLRAGDSIHVGDEVVLEIIHPDNLLGNANNNSLVILLKYRENQILLTADIGKKIQEQLLASYPQIIHSDIIQVPHHGSYLSHKFLETLGDKRFILSTGSNQWGAPHEKDLEVIKGNLYRTDQDGTILLNLDGYNIKVKTYE